MSKVFVIDTNKKPLEPIHPAQARQLLRNKKAAIFRQFSFTIILKESRTEQSVSPLRLKIDPGAKYTGLGLVNDSTGEVTFAAEIKHRGFIIRDSLTSRRQLRRSRRNRKTRYRQPRFLNRTKPIDRRTLRADLRLHQWAGSTARRVGWLPPSLESRIANIKTWVIRLRKLAPIATLSQELVKFDTPCGLPYGHQLMQNPDIQGKEYQQGSLAGYETREYLLEKWKRFGLIVSNSPRRLLSAGLLGG